MRTEVILTHPNGVWEVSDSQEQNHWHQLSGFLEWPTDIQTALIPLRTEMALSQSLTKKTHGNFPALLSIQTGNRSRTFSSEPSFSCDNLHTATWISRFWTSKSKVAGNILLALTTRFHRKHIGQTLVDHIPGLLNVLADYTSVNTQLTPAKFFIRFYIHILPATAFLLDLVPIQNGMKSLLFSTLRHIQLTIA